jgi:hypothetical protein
MPEKRCDCVLSIRGATKCWNCIVRDERLQFFQQLEAEQASCYDNYLDAPVEPNAINAYVQGAFADELMVNDLLEDGWIDKDLNKLGDW